jgi:hypothetical protein
MTKKKTLAPKQIKAIALLSSGLSQDKVAEEVGVQYNTIVEWQKSDLFREELRITAERARQTFESRVFNLANNSAVIVGDMIQDTKNKERQLEGVKLAFGAAVRLANRYKELQVEGFIAPTQPLVVFPPGTQFPWKNKAVLPPKPLEIPDVIDVEATEAEGPDDGSA